MNAPATLTEAFRQHLSQTPAAPCLSFQDATLSFADLASWSARIAAFLKQRGIGKGDRVAILSHNGPQFYALFFACAELSAIMMPLNWRLSAREIEDILDDGEPGIILASDELRHLLPDGGASAIALAALDELPEAPPRSGLSAPDAAALILYTSGTTGRPKGAVLSHRALGHCARIAPFAWRFDAASVNLVGMPLFHIGGIGYGMMALTQGGHTVLLRDADPAVILRAMDRWSVTHAFFVPTVIQRLVELVEAGTPAPTTLEIMVYGAAPIGETLLRRAIAAFVCGFSHAYGMTESAGTIVSLPPEDHDLDGPNAARLRSCGKAFPWVEIALVDPATGAVVGDDAIGEIRIRSEMLMSGYWRKPDETAAALDAEGWFHSGDAATRDADGYIFICDRFKDMIVSGGENIYPAEIEHVLQAHPAVAEVVVIGVPHPKWGETPRACVVAAPGAAAEEAELIEFARERLARYKCPSSVRFLDTFPRNASGKVLKHELRAAAAAEASAETVS